MDRRYDDRGGYGRRGYDDYGGRSYGGKGGYDDRRGGYDDRRGGYDRDDKGSSYRDTRDSQWPSRGNGGGGYGRGGDRRGGKGRLVPEGPRQRGVVASVKDSFGFIECEESDERVFFHFSEIEDRDHRVERGDCLEFGVATDSRSGRTSACEIGVLRPGSVVLEEQLKGRFEGVVVKELRGSRPQEASGGMILLQSSEEEGDLPEEKIAFQGSDLDDIRWKPAEGDVVHFNIVFVKRKQQKQAKKITLVKPGGGNREQGIISSVKESFGFVECTDRPARLFFHFTELMDRSHEPRVNDEVEFNVMPSDRHGQDNCSRVVILPKGTVSFETVQEGRWRGRVSQEIRSAPRRRNNMKGGAPLDKPSGRIVLEPAAGEEQASAPSEEGAPADSPEEENEVENKAANETAVECNMRDVADAAAETLVRVSVKGPKSVSFDKTSLGRGCDQLIVGDIVEMTLVVDKRTKQQRASEIVITEENPNRDQGIVCGLRDMTASVRCASRENRMMFDLRDVRTEGHDVKIGDCVEFTASNNGACRVDVLPAGSVVLDEALEGRRRGKVTKLDVSKPDQWSRNKESAKLSSGGLIEAEGEDGEVMTLRFSTQDLKNETNLDTRALLALGDTVEFDAVLELRTKKLTALALELVEMDQSKREQGTVNLVKDNFGFIKSADRDVRIFFHFTQQMNNTGEPPFGAEVEFNAEPGDAKGDTATRVKILPKGTVVFEVAIEGRYRGTVVTEATKKMSARSHGQRPDFQSVPGLVIVDAVLVEELLPDFAAVDASAKAATKAIRKLEGNAAPGEDAPKEEAAEVTVPPAEAAQETVPPAEAAEETVPPAEAAPAEDMPKEAVEGTKEQAEGAAAEEEAPCADTATAEDSTPEAQAERKLSVRFRLEDVVDRATPYLGDEVEFSLVVQRRNGALMAKDVVAIPKPGVVSQVRGRQGFIKHTGLNESGMPSTMESHFYTDDVADGVHLNAGDEVEFIVVFDSRQRSSRCVNIVRTKECEVSERPTRTRMQLTKKSIATGSVQSKGPDGTVGFAYGSYGRQRKYAQPEPELEPEPAVEPAVENGEEEGEQTVEEQTVEEETEVSVDAPMEQSV